MRNQNFKGECLYHAKYRYPFCILWPSLEKGRAIFSESAIDIKYREFSLSTFFASVGKSLQLWFHNNNFRTILKEMQMQLYNIHYMVIFRKRQMKITHTIEIRILHLPLTCQEFDQDYYFNALKSSWYKGELTLKLCDSCCTTWPESCTWNVWVYSSEICNQLDLELTLGSHSVSHSRICQLKNRVCVHFWPNPSNL